MTSERQHKHASRNDEVVDDDHSTAPAESDGMRRAELTKEVEETTTNIDEAIEDAEASLDELLDEMHITMKVSLGYDADEWVHPDELAKAADQAVKDFVQKGGQ